MKFINDYQFSSTVELLHVCNENKTTINYLEKSEFEGRFCSNLRSGLTCILEIYLEPIKMSKNEGPTEIRTRIVGFKVQSDSHYTIRP